MGTIRDRQKGALYGEAIGDALGMPWEFTTGEQCTEKKVQYRKPFITHMSMGWQAGEFTDDTTQAIALAHGLLEFPDDMDKAAHAIANRFQRWLVEDGRGAGRLTVETVGHIAYLIDPIAVSRETWEDHGKVQAPNGGVMRTVGAAIIRPWDINWTIKAARTGCIVTHADPRCIASCIAVSTAISYLIMQEKGVVDVLEASWDWVNDMPEDLDGSEFDRHFAAPTLEALDLNESHKIGYTYKCMGAGFWALRELVARGPDNHNFWEILTEVCKAGGDTDTNAAVAGALMGARLGYENLSSYLVAELKRKDELEGVLAALPAVPEE